MNSKGIDNKPNFLRLSKEEQLSAIEALIFASEEPLSSEQLYKILIKSNQKKEKIDEQNSEELLENEDYNEISPEYFDKLVEEINSSLHSTGRVFSIIKVGGGYKFATNKEYGQLINYVTKVKSKRKLSQPALETLAIIAYKQPITKPEIDAIRGVNSGDVINSLLEKNLIQIIGRKDALGKPLLYATTTEFLLLLGINSLDDLPKLNEFMDRKDVKLEYDEQDELTTIIENKN